MASDWDMPARNADDAAQPRRPSDGMVSPLAFLRFVFRNLFKIVVLAAVMTGVAVMLFRIVPFPYRATATVLVDPRNQQVTLQEDVLSPIGSDAAILESMVQILKSDGFLLTVMNQVGIDGETWSKLSQTQQLEELDKFKKNLLVERKGATYLVEVTYKSKTAQEAARMANAVANSFADTQNGYLSQATENAARALSERLVELRRKLNASEQAVADFAAAHGILYVDGNSTLQTRQLTELSAQLAAARTATEEARARYQQQLDGGDGAMISTGRNAEPAQLTYLRQQRTQLTQQLQQQSLTYGPRHPRIAETQRLIDGIERQIRDERRLLVQQLGADVDVAQAQQKKLEDDIAKLSTGKMLSDAEEVKLEALRREAAADRDIYEKFLSRNKATDELAELKSENVKVVSPAVPPLKSSRPPMLLMLPIFGLLSAAAATAFVAAGSSAAGSVRSRRAARRETAEAADAASSHRPVAEAAHASLSTPTIRADRQESVARAPDAAQPEPHTPPAASDQSKAEPARRRPVGTSLLMLEQNLRKEARREGAEPLLSVPGRPSR